MARRGNNIYRRKDGRWEGRFVKGRENSRTKFGYVFGKSYSEVLTLLDKARYEWEARSSTEICSRSTVRSVSASWLADPKMKRKKSTTNRYSDYLRCYILPEFGDYDMADITDACLEDFLRTLLSTGGTKRTGLSRKIVSEVFRVMRYLQKHAISLGIAVGYSLESISIAQEQKDTRVFTAAELETLCSYLERSRVRSHIGIMLSLGTGIRLGEVCALKCDSILLAKKELHINGTMQRLRVDGAEESDAAKTKIVVTPPKSERSIRSIPLSDNLVAHIAPLYKSGTYLLSGQAEKSIEPRTMQNHFKAVLKACGIANANFHTLRHTFATYGIEAGIEPKCLSDILGHASINITLSRYVHVTMEMKRQNMAKVNFF